MSPAVEAVRARALALLRPQDRYAVATDTHTYSRTTKAPPAVLIAIVTQRKGVVESIVLAIDASEYDATASDPGAAVMIAEFLGAQPYEPPKPTHPAATPPARRRQ